MYGRVGACKPTDADADADADADKTPEPEREAVADAGRADAGRAGERERVKDGSYPNDAVAVVDDGAMDSETERNEMRSRGGKATQHTRVPKIR